MNRLWIVPCLLVTAAHAADPSALWHIAHDRCVPHQQNDNDPGPCSLVDLASGYVILKDIVGATQFLLIPTARIGGIESAAILEPGAANYWDEAWRARHFMEDRAGKPLPRETISLAINSPYGRTQDQLHIHIDCVRADVHDAIVSRRDEIGRTWSAFPTPLVNLPWRALRVDGENLDRADPFRLLADGDRDAAADMAKHTLVVVGMTYQDNQPGFVVLDGKVDVPAGNRASGEVLQDHDCALAH
jgi:CDP-diacylglycerol pyrophosphatase